MKRCPQCNSVFEDTQAYCTEDGAALIDENFVLPSESSVETEEETVIHHEPIKIDIIDPQEVQSEKVEYEILSTDDNAPIIIEEPRNTGKYFLFLVIGLFLGGIIVLGALFLILSQIRKSNTEKPNDNVQISGGKHNQRNQTRKDSEFNGFVLSETANIRSAPSSGVLDSLPKNDRLSILERDGAWYRVICEHGVGGWMHGNTIRFNDNADPF